MTKLAGTRRARASEPNKPMCSLMPWPGLGGRLRRGPPRGPPRRWACCCPAAAARTLRELLPMAAQLTIGKQAQIGTRVVATSAQHTDATRVGRRQLLLLACARHDSPHPVKLPLEHFRQGDSAVGRRPRHAAVDMAAHRDHQGARAAPVAREQRVAKFATAASPERPSLAQAHASCASAYPIGLAGPTCRPSCP